MKKAILVCALGIAALAAAPARADQFSFSFAGPNVSFFNQSSFSGSGTLFATYTGTGNLWDITGITGTVTDDTYVNHTTTDSTTYDIGNLLPAVSFMNNDNILYYPTLLNFDLQGVSFSLVGSSNDVNLDTGVFIIFPYNQGTQGQQSELISESICWQGPGDPPAATPEPGSLALLGTSILGGAGILRRRFRA